MKLRSHPSELRLMRAFVGRWAERTGLGREQCYEACLVATEAVTNAIRHSGGDEEITVCCRRADGELLISVQDRGTFRSGPVATTLVIEDPGPEDLGGRGLFLIQELTRGFEIEKGEQGEQGTRLSMRMGVEGGLAAAA
ncbi:MAG TPA: ATP-binding protein [Thermoleophilaceae bacterium]|nr:ATP-binding protein [Thermoleophilaceae bacterium]